MTDYYKTCAFAKPSDKKKKKKQNGWKNKNKRICYYCGTAGAERHEVFGGPLRQISIDNGFQVDLCNDCHEEVTKNTEKGKNINDYWRKFYQRSWMNKLISAGATEEEAFVLWMSPKFVGKNYL